MTEIISENTMMNAYILSAKAREISLDGMLRIHGIICETNPELYSEGFMYHAGPELADAAALAAVLEKNPDISVAIVADGENCIAASYGPGTGTLAPAIEALRTAGGKDSYAAVSCIGGK